MYKLKMKDAFVSTPYSRLFCQRSGKHCLADHKYQQEPTSTCAHSKAAAYRQSPLSTIHSSSN